MSIRETIQIGHPALKAENQTIEDFPSEKVKQIIDDLVDTMRKNELVGMAAPQIAENYRIFITEPKVTPSRILGWADELRIYLNGVEFSGKVSDYKKLMAKEFYLENIKNSKEQINNSRVTKKEVVFL